MRWTSGAIAAAAMLAPVAGEAQNGRVAQDFCNALNRMVQVAQMDGDFELVERSRPAPPHFGFRHGCRAQRATERLPGAWWCHQNLAPEELSLDSLAERTGACLPSAARSSGRWGREAIFTLPRARIVIEQSGGPRAKVGRIVTYRIEAVRP